MALKISTVPFSPLLVLPALFLDEMLGEPQVLHPLSLFGGYAGQIEELFHPGQAIRRRIATNVMGGLALGLAVVPPVVALSLARRRLVRRPLALAFLDSLVLYFCIAPGSLFSHARDVYSSLSVDDLELARQMVGRIVSRDTSNLNEEQVATATIESVLENGNDAVFGALFWFLVGGSGGSLFYRLANTLDAMWGYRNERFLDFGCPAARLDDVLNYVPARLTSMSYALAGDTKTALACWGSQSGQWYSPNAGPVMAAGAGALNLELGGAAVYHGKLKERPVLGRGRKARPDDIERANALVSRALRIWSVAAVAIGIIGGVCAFVARRQSR